MRKITVTFFVLLYVGLIGLSEWQVRFWRASSQAWETVAHARETEARRWEKTANTALSVAQQAEKTAVNCAGVVQDFSERLNRLRAENSRLRVKASESVPPFQPLEWGRNSVDGGVWIERNGSYCGWGMTGAEARKQCSK